MAEALPVSALEEALGHPFRDPALIARALTHPSWAHEHPPAPDNEGLAFLGDAILGFLVAESLFRRAPEAAVGSLTQARARLVSTRTLARWARRVGLAAHLRLGVGEERTGGRDKESILASALEAVVGALYLDGGLEAARGLVLGLVAGDERDASL